LRSSGQKNISKNPRVLKPMRFKDQQDLLLDLVKTSEKTLFGREHRFETIKSIEDFQNNVPIADYEDLKPYIEKVKKGQSKILWPDLPEYFAKTSGTTSSKYIPISKEAMPFQIAAAQSAIFHYIGKKNNADFVGGKMIFLQGSPELEEVNGVKTEDFQELLLIIFQIIFKKTDCQAGKPTVSKIGKPK
jgi:hypothetical protein